MISAQVSFKLGQASGTNRDKDRSAEVPTVTVGLYSFDHQLIGVEHACALDTGDRIWCWGSNRTGQLALGYDGGSSDVPVLVDDSPWARLGRTDGVHQCALKANGDAYCAAIACSDCGAN